MTEKEYFYIADSKPSKTNFTLDEISDAVLEISVEKMERYFYGKYWFYVLTGAGIALFLFMAGGALLAWAGGM